jgi:hypothetical protein
LLKVIFKGYQFSQSMPTVPQSQEAHIDCQGHQSSGRPILSWHKWGNYARVFMGVHHAGRSRVQFEISQSEANSDPDILVPCAGLGEEYVFVEHKVNKLHLEESLQKREFGREDC